MKLQNNPGRLKPFSKFYVALGLMAVVTLASCSKDDNNNNSSVYDRIKPSQAPPAWGPDIAQQMQAVIETLDSIAKPIHTLTVAEARTQPSPADAVKRVMQNFNVPTPVSNVDTAGKDIPVAGGTIHLRIYTPRTGKTNYPVIVYYHGGGWVIATIDTYNSSAQNLAEKTDAIVVAVEYRKGPEYRFPAAHNDAFAAYKWTLANANSYNGDTAKVALAGESAGGNMVITVSMMARDSGIKMPLHIVSVYPVASMATNTPSKLQYTTSSPLSTPDLPWFLNYYLATPGQASNPLIDLVNANLTGLPATTIIAAELDPLQSEGMTLSTKLQAANVSVNYKLYNGVTHEFFGMSAVVPQAEDAENLAANDLKNAFK